MDPSEEPVPSLSPNADPTAKSYQSSKYKIYCEDDYFAEESLKWYHPRCDQMRQCPPSPLPFNYPRFSQFVKLKSQITLENLKVSQSHGMVFKLGIYDDFTLKDEIFGIYGEMDESSERFQTIFKNYKIQRLEQLNEWVEALWADRHNKDYDEDVDDDEEKDNNDNDDDKDDYDDDDCAGREGLEYSDSVREYFDEEEELLKHFSPEEIKQFRSVSEGGSSSIEPFLLPRKRDANDPTESEESTPKLRNHAKIATKAVFTIVHEHPLGLKIDLFFEKCREELRKTDYCGPPITTDMLRRPPLTEIVCLEKYSNSSLIFPSELRPYLVPNPLQILRNLKHNMLAILNLSYGILEVTECVHLLNKIFHADQFDFHDWGYKTEEAFVKDVFDKWKSVNVEVVELAINRKPAASYLAIVDKKRKKLIEDKLASKRSHKPSSQASNTSMIVRPSRSLFNENIPTFRAISPTSSQNANKPKPGSSSTTSPWNKTMEPVNVTKPPLLNYDAGATSINPKFVQPGDIMYREQDGIIARSQMGCVVAFVNSPTNFYLVNQVKWKELNSQLFHKLGDYWLANPTSEWPHPRFLQKNYICMAKTDSEEEHEVYRVVILGKPDTFHYQVFCVDYGDLLKVKHEQLRYMPREYLHFMEAQAISCSLYNVASPRKDPGTGNDIWSKEVCDFTRGLFLPKDKNVPLVKVHFKQRVNGTGKWLVKVSSPATMDFGEEIMKFVETDTKTKK